MIVKYKNVGYMMKKYLGSLIVLFVFILMACGTDLAHNEENIPEDEGKANLNNSIQNEEEEKVQEDRHENKESLSEEADEGENIILQLSKEDEASGITLDNDEIYIGIQEMIEQDPKMGEDNNVNFLPIGSIGYEVDRIGLVILLVNRLNNPVRNIAFNLTLGDDKGNYIVKDEQITLTEDYLGELDKNGAVPFTIEITEDEEKLFYTLTNENMKLIAKDLEVDFVE